jgi:polyhydroxyalkanoate synthesis regulator phasin
MSDLDRIKNNVAKMAAQGAPEADIDGYIASEGVTIDQVRAHKTTPVQAATDPTTGEIVEDVAKSAGIGLVQGGLGLASMPGNLEALGRAGINYGAGALGYKGNVVDPETVIPDYNDYKQAVEGFTGEFYEPKTTVGQYARTIGEFAPAAVGGPGGLAARAARVAAPAVASEGAGQIAEGTGYEGAARVAGAVAGSLAPSVAMRAPANAIRSKNVKTLQNEGVTALTRGQKIGSERLRRFEDAANQIPFSGQVASRMQDQAAEQFTRAALKRALTPRLMKDLEKRGINASRATDEVMDAGFSAFSDSYKKLAPRMTIYPDNTLLTRIRARANEYTRGTQAGAVRPMISELADELYSKGTMIGDDAARYLSNLKRQSRGMTNDPDAQRAIGDMIEMIQGNIVAQAKRRGGDQAAAALKKDMRNLNTRYRNMIALEDAVANSAAVPGSQGLITPAKLRAAVKKQGKRDMVRGKNDLGRLARAGDEVMTPLSSSGTAERAQYINILNNPFSLGAGSGGAALGTMVAGPVGGIVGAAGGAVAPGLASRGLMGLTNFDPRIPVAPPNMGSTYRTLGVLPAQANKDEYDEATRLGRALMMQGR